MRPSDEILEELNRLNVAKKTEVYGNTELSELIIKIGDLGANAYKLGKMSEEDAQNFIEQVPSKDWFNHNYKNLDRASKTILESFSMAGLENDKKNVTVSEKQYTKTTGIAV